jgi:hypothetical protein
LKDNFFAHKIKSYKEYKARGYEMEVKHITSSAYAVIEDGKKHVLVKVLGTYDNKKEATADKFKVLNKEVTENELEKKWRESK